MKKTLSAVLSVLTAAVLLSGCGGEAAKVTTAAAPAATTAAPAAPAETKAEESKADAGETKAEAAAETDPFADLKEPEALEKVGDHGKIEIKYSTWANDGEAAYEGMKQFKKLVEDATDGAITVSLYPSNQTGTTNEQMEQMSMNQLQMVSCGDPGVSEIEYLCLPYLFNSLDKYTEFLETDLGKSYIQKSIDSRDIRILDTIPRSPRIISSNIEINSLADMKNMKIRAPERDYYVETFKALGANPTPMDLGETYSAMQTGVVEGQENPIETIVSYGFQNVNKYLVLSNHIIKPGFVMINNTFFNELPAEYQDVILKACAASKKYAEDYMDIAMDLDKQTCIDAGMIICEPDLQEWADATAGVRDTLGTKVWGEDGYAIVKEIAAK